MFGYVQKKLGEIMKFVKMQAAGNDFILFNGEEYKNFTEGRDRKTKIAKLCDRHFGIGSDGLMFQEFSNVADIKMNYYNSDGSTAELCGNGIRCFAQFVYDEGIIKKQKFDIETLAGIMKVELFLTDNKVSVNIGKPVFNSEKIPIIVDDEFENERHVEQSINLNERNFGLNVLKVGVPHTVIFEDIKSEMEEYGKKIETHKIFPNGTNVNFVNIIDRKNITLKTWERGVGKTLACGTGACASVIAGIKKNLLNKTVTVKTEGGKLVVSLNEKGEVILTGDVETVFIGEISI